VDDINQVTREKNNLLIRPFSEEEVVFQMEQNQAPGLDGFPTEFFQACCGIIKSDLMALFLDFYADNLLLYSLNFGTIILLLKCREAIHIKQYRPICL
jgi:hypothetical protein